MKRLFVASALAVVLVAAGMQGARAANPDKVITYGGQSYDITYASGSFTSLLPTLESEPWWGNSTLAYNLAFTLGNTLGDPYFAYATNGSTAMGDEYLQGPGFIAGTATPVSGNYPYTEIVPVSVPEPASIALFGFGIAGIVWIVCARRRRRWSGIG